MGRGGAATRALQKKLLDEGFYLGDEDRLKELGLR